MAKEDIIQKDLGLVTAYGYALAGGYQGTEEQFKQDFAALMQGQYNALRNKPSINGVELVGNKTSLDLHIFGASYESIDVTSSFSAHSSTPNLTIVYARVHRYGKISFVDVVAQAEEDVQISAGYARDLFNVDPMEVKAIPKNYCPIISVCITDNLYPLNCVMNYDSTDSFYYLYNIEKSTKFKKIQFQGVFISEYDENGSVDSDND